MGLSTNPERYIPPTAYQALTEADRDVLRRQMNMHVVTGLLSGRPLSGFPAGAQATQNTTKNILEMQEAARLAAQAETKAARDRVVQQRLSDIFGVELPQVTADGAMPAAPTPAAAAAAATAEGGAPAQAPAAPGGYDRRTSASRYFLAAREFAAQGDGETAKKYVDTGLSLHPNPSEAVRDIEYIFGNSLAGRGQEGLTMLTDYQRSKQPQTKITTNVNVPAERKGEEAFFSELGKRLPELESQAVAASSTNEALQDIVNLSQKSTFSGTLAPGAIGATQFLQSFGMQIKPETMANTREFQAASNILVLDFMGAMGGARGFSKEESAILYDAFPKIIDSPQARERIARMLISRNNRIIRDFQAARDQFNKGVGRQLPTREVQPLNLPPPAAGGEGGAAPRRYNPKTGKFE